MQKGETKCIIPFDDDDDDDDEPPWFGRLSCNPSLVFAALALGRGDESGFSLPVPTLIAENINKYKHTIRRIIES